MSINGRHAYRFGFLKSEQWQTLRLTCIALDEGKCRVCGKYDESNDAHHLFYRGQWGQTKVEDLLTLCRACHKKVHELGADVLHKDLWDKYQYLFRIKGANSCHVCLGTSTIIKEKKLNKGGVLKFCPECFKSLRDKSASDGGSFWKLLDHLKREVRIPAVRRFHADTLRAILQDGIEKHLESKMWQKALRNAGEKIRKYILTDR